MRKKKRLLFYFMVTLLLTGCKVPNSESSLNSEEPTSSEKDTSISESSSVEELVDYGGLASGNIAQVLPIFSNEKAANIASFPTDIIHDPLIAYTDNDYIVKPFLNGFTYPVDARVQPTNAYLEFWHPTTSIDLRIVASNKIFKLINDNGQNIYKELYFPVTLQVIMNNKQFTYYEVGMRMKGNTSRRSFVDDNGNFYDNINFKLSFNELWTDDIYAQFGLKKTWTEVKNREYTVRDKRTFMGNSKDGSEGLKKIDIKWNKSQDESLVIQPFVFSFFQKHGVITQNSTLATLKYNDTNMGVVTVNEPINKHLIYRYFTKDASKGALYKVGWGFGRRGNLRIEEYEQEPRIIGKEDKATNYEPVYDRKEGDNKDKNLLNLMTVLRDNEGKSPTEYKKALEGVVDMDSFLTYAAIAYLTGNPDDMRNHGNNYYIYFNPMQNNKAYFIPYDYDWSMGLTWGPRLNGTSPLSTRHKATDEIQTNRLYWYTISEPNRSNYNITLNKDYQNEFINKVHAFNNDQHYSSAGYNFVYENYKITYEIKTYSNLDRENYHISRFNGTSSATTFINDVKNAINEFIPR